ncbi:hypothetical protein AKJ09_04171 [Labilithrix luteola]|uniref:Caa(3)-type oxidase, subunit IV n=1 Tax=Labilithrix luteola TaxID=1391654 RepID=A0A0K1PVF0_9BACT|nr:cytochrome C oxidase subunit IV family protein [Labilithrix luteola]AKU97507.1 hypothetical protein AKJ09_04171 [Labilithrix luteola]
MTHESGTRAIWRTAIALMVLWALSFGLSYVHLGAASLPVALAIAGMKAGLVAMVFMELVRAHLSVHVTLAAACLLSLILVGLTVADVLTRDKPPIEVPAIAKPWSSEKR